jgi:uncharacterized membrane protein YfcA
VTGGDLRGRGEGLADAVIGLLLLGLAAALFWMSRDIPSPPFVPVTPAFFPRVLAGVLAGLAALLVLRGSRRRGRDGEPRAARGPLRPAVLVYGALAAYAFAIPRLGFYASTFVFLLVLVGLLGERTARGAVRALAVAVATTAACYAVFTGYLRLFLPEGLLR